MPRIAEFYGIVIYMYYREHGMPHFHALYSGREAVIGIDTLRTIEGRLPAASVGFGERLGQAAPRGAEPELGTGASGSATADCPPGVGSVTR